jgi:L-amino acid N-acyltransferase YncA
MANRRGLVVTIRSATAEDARAIQEIYAPIVEHTFISFEAVVPAVDEMLRRIKGTLTTHPWLVAEEGSKVVGYAYAAPHGERAAYRWSVDTSAYIDEARRGQGIGRLLYMALIEELVALGHVSAYAGIALPNEASVGLHEGVGFRPIGAFPKAGFKLGVWRDVGLWWRPLRDPPDEPEDPRRYGA